MSEEEYYEDEFYDEEGEEGEEGHTGSFSDQVALVHRTPWWIISIVFHAAFFFMTAMLVVSEVDPNDGIDIFEMDIDKFKKPEYDPTLKRDIKKSKEVDNETLIEDPVITKEDLPIEELETPDDLEREHKAKGRQEAISTIELEGDGWIGVFGVGGGGSGMYGWRDGGGKRRAIGRGGGSAATESAVEAALRWFKRHQAPDGSWSYSTYHEQCKEVPPCEHLDIEREEDRWDNSATGFALLCFLGAGHTHKAGRYRPQVANGLAFLESAQDEDGSFSKDNYVHSITTMAVAEAYAMTKSANLKEMAQQAVNVIMERQNEYLGWDYGRPSTRSDISVTGWNIMALKSAKSADLNIGNSFEGAKAVIEKATPEIVGETDPQMSEDVAYTYYTDKDDPGHRNRRLTGIGLLCRVFMGQDTKGRVLRAHGNRILESLPKNYERGDFYLWYYATLAMFQMGGDYWKQWNEALKEILCDNQRMGGCADGSWDPTENVGGRHAGRVFTTATGCLSLEIYYRYLPVSMLK